MPSAQENSLGSADRARAAFARAAPDLLPAALNSAAMRRDSSDPRCPGLVLSRIDDRGVN